MTINDLGWQVYTTKIPDATRHNPQHVGRVVFQDATRYGVFSNHGETEGIVRGAMRRGAAFSSQLPKVGDWVVIEPLPGEAKVVIKEVLPRFSKISRKALGKKGEEQVVACNINTAFIVEGLDNDFNLNRLERYLAAIIQSGAQPVILLNKADVHMDAVQVLAQVQAAHPDVPVYIVSALQETGLEALTRHVPAGETSVVVGSSGAGKSTLINVLLHTEVQKTKEVRADDSRGRHTTTRRELFMLPGGGMCIDTPGMRELQLWAETSAPAESVFADIEALSEQCRYHDCDHEKSEGCAVLAAVESGEIDGARYRSYLKLKKELAFGQSKHMLRIQHDRRDNAKRLSRQIKQLYKTRRARQFGKE